ncbi:Hypothetical_protein [Hexamita inflata]|uniref:Hypothetical_protein n=1 Tax=Hexamita inflata TaxID=28002 RepID=A0AA86N5I1_9EUKA|nr:Hypothetical protein HINF_LOCUS907 [Hexamita inflata]
MHGWSHDGLTAFAYALKFDVVCLKGFVCRRELALTGGVCTTKYSFDWRSMCLLTSQFCSIWLCLQTCLQPIVLNNVGKFLCITPQYSLMDGNTCSCSPSYTTMQSGVCTCPAGSSFINVFAVVKGSELKLNEIINVLPVYPWLQQRNLLEWWQLLLS